MPISIIDYSIVSPLGWGRDAHRQNLCEPNFQPTYKLNVSEFELADYLFERLKPHTAGVAPERVAIVLSNSKYNFGGGGGLTFLPHSLCTYLASKVGKGCIPYCVSAACATGLVSVMTGVDWLRRGWVDVVISGSLETSKVPLIEAAFSQMGVLSKQGTCHPFSRDRDGFVVGEGGALFVLSRSRKDDGAIAKIEGGAMMADPTDILSPDPAGRSIAQLIKKTIGMSAIDYVNAHGTGTRPNDSAELEAFKHVFTDQKPLISSTKAQTGHLLGATGSVELGLCLLSMEHRQVLYQKNLDFPMPGILPFQETPRQLNRILTLNYGFGGHLAALMIARP